MNKFRARLSRRFHDPDSSTGSRGEARQAFAAI